MRALLVVDVFVVCGGTRGAGGKHAGRFRCRASRRPAAGERRRHAEKPMAAHRAGLGRGEESGDRRRFRHRRRPSQAGRSLGESSIAQSKEQQDAWKDGRHSLTRREPTRLDRRNVLRWLAVARLAGVTPRVAFADDDDLYDVGRFGNVRLLHITDTHAQLQPVYFREPSVNLGVGDMRGKPPHLVGGAFLEYFSIAAGRPRRPRLHLPRLSRRPRTATAAWAASRI